MTETTTVREPDRRSVPPGACDCHSHIYGPRDRFPYPAGVEPPPDASLAAYRRLMAGLGIERFVIVQPSAYRDDNARTLAAIRELGLERARGVAVTAPDVGAAELRRLTEGGMRGLRFHELAEGCLPFDRLEPMAARIAPFGWHVQIQGDGSRLPEWEARLRHLPVPVVIDHVGRIPPGGGAAHPAFRALLRLLETGRVWVKLSAFYYGSAEGPPGYGDMAARVRALVAARPDRLVWGANWPHPNFPAGAKPDDRAMFDRLLEWIPDPPTRAAVLADNAAGLYGFD